MFRETFDAVVRDAQYAFGPRESSRPRPMTDSEVDCFEMVKGNPGVKENNSPSYRGFTVLIAITVAMLGATYLCATKTISSDQYMALIVGCFGYLFGRGSK